MFAFAFSKPVVRRITPSSDGAGIYPQVQGDPAEDLAQPSNGTPGTTGLNDFYSTRTVQQERVLGGAIHV